MAFMLFGTVWGRFRGETSLSFPDSSCASLWASFLPSFGLVWFGSMATTLLKNPLRTNMPGRGTDTCIQVRKGPRLTEGRLKSRTLSGLSPAPMQHAGNGVSFTFGTIQNSFPRNCPGQLSSARVEMARRLKDLSLRHRERPLAGGEGWCSGEWGGDKNPLLFSSLSCSGVQSPAGRVPPRWAGSCAHVLRKEASDCVLETELRNGNASIVTHTDARKLQTQSHYGWSSEQR